MQYLIAILLFLSACTTTEVHKGAELRQSKIDEITPESSREDVAKLLGTPSSKSSFGDEVWYYINNVRKKNIVSDDELLDQQVLAVTFKEDKVAAVETYDISKSNNVQFNEDKTATAGRELTIIEQMLGNLGKFNTDSMADKIGSKDR
jgi:outer membrane protein assembly factor BamE (lipoprotein component of BamABCDE complex)